MKGKENNNLLYLTSRCVKSLRTTFFLGSDDAMLVTRKDKKKASCIFITGTKRAPGSNCGGGF